MDLSATALTPGTYTLGSGASAAQSGYEGETTVWREWTQPAPAEGSFSLTIASVGDVIDDAGTRPVHGSFTGVFPITTNLQTDAGTVTGQATF